MNGDEHYVYHAPVEPSPRATASGGQNVVEARISQPEYIAHNVHAAEVERPGYVSLGAAFPDIVRGLLRVSPPDLPSGYHPVSYPDRYPSVLPAQQQPGPQRLPPGSVPTPTPICPAWGCGGPPTRVPVYSYPGATSTVPQPPPSAGGSQVVPITGPISAVPAPSPTVAVSHDQTAPQLTQPGTTLDASGSSITTAGGIGTWLAQSTLINGIPNWGLAAVGVFVAMTMFGGKAGRR